MAHLNVLFKSWEITLRDNWSFCTILSSLHSYQDKFKWSLKPIGLITVIHTKPFVTYYQNVSSSSA